jgi:flagellar biosynthetic protein FlhB
MAEPDHDRTEPATPYKREEARRRGQVAKSLDTNSFFILAAALAAVTLWGARLLLEGARACQDLLRLAGSLSFDPVSLNRWGGAVMREALYQLTPPLLLVIAAGLIANFV